MKLKNLYLILMLILGSTLMAQEKYEQAVVYQVPGVIYKSVEGQELEKIKDSKASSVDFTPVIREIASMKNQGWEVWNSSYSPNGLLYFLRRKLK